MGIIIPSTAGLRELAYAEITATFLTPNTNDDVTGLAVTFTASGRVVYVTVCASAQFNGTAAQFSQIELRESAPTSTQLAVGPLWQSINVNQGTAVHLQRRVVPSVGSHTYKVVFGRTGFSSASNASLVATATSPAFLAVFEAVA